MPDRYARTLAAFLSRPDEPDLEEARRLGRELLAKGLAAREVVKLHREALQSVSVPATQHDAAWRFLDEVLGALERRAAERSRILASIVDSINDGIIAADTTGAFVFVNRAAKELFGKDMADTPPDNWSNEFGLFELDGVTPFPAERLPLVRAMSGEPTEPVRLLVRNPDRPPEAYLSIVGSPLRQEDGGIEGGVVLFSNISALLHQEEQLRQLQKMDAIGRLAGGIAHDFNNLLSVIISYASLIMRGVDKDDPIAADAQEVNLAGRRAAELTRQLLMVSHHRAHETRVLDLNAVLVAMDKVLKRLLGADIDYQMLPGHELGKISADPSNLEHVVMNLVINARDAMPKGGKLRIETSSVLLDDAFARAHVGTTPGAYVKMAVSDTGVGMDRATQGRIFEPFSSSRGIGDGGGMGLATVFGFIQRLGGSIWVQSELGKGTTFNIYIPRTDREVSDAAINPAPAILQGSETVLLVEDDDQLRVVARQILHLHGYRVEECRNAGEGLLRAEDEGAHYDLLLTDVVMPQMSGPELARRLVHQRPTLKVLCMSGYTDDSIVRHGVLDADIAYLQKPFTPESLARRVREVLDAPPLEGKGHALTDR